MKSKNLSPVLMILVALIMFNACKKSQTAVQPNEKSAKLRTHNVYIDSVYISALGPVYESLYTQYDTIKVYHFNTADTIRVFVSSTYGGLATMYGSGQGPLYPSKPWLSYSMENAITGIQQHHAGSGFYTDTYHLTISQVLDAHFNDITSQVKIVPAEGVDAHVYGQVVSGVSDTSKCPGCPTPGGH
jgi:hypothetical protein